MDHVNEFAARLLSRKFLLCLSAAIGLFANKQYPEAAAVVVTYLTAEGAADFKRAESY